MNTSHRVLALASTCLALSSLSSQAYADKLGEVLERGEIVIGTGTANPPWHFTQNGETVGFDADIGHLLAKGLFNDPSKVRFVNQSSDARIPNLLTGNVDLSCQAMTVTAARAQQVEFTIPYYREGVGLLLRAGGDYGDFDALTQAGTEVTVAVLQNVYAEEMVHKALPEAKVDQYQSQDMIYQALNSRRADAVATDLSTLRWYLQQNPDRYVDAGYAWMPQSYSCAVAPGDQRWLNFLNTTLFEAMHGVEFDAYAQAYEKWFGETPPAPRPGFPSP
ncbi:transporter substrate-binding domain-containing protein [Halotalea alkalilenta]|uniref:ABC transporter substrate-binding protein n=1 Tax=Halotalea alkalilenta TaxID=376489 RepID=A0A172YGG0_9GAMM|nr:transporter substrate-binding domain-containing protein [Halotalea alkalilenta]ANF58142.1 ABC transporter substrate-binding protein [Halotalea alkalilenta]